MSKKTISLKIDVSKIDKKRLYQGEKGTYLDAVLLFDTQEDKFGNHGMIVESVTKEEREQKVKGTILGNAKILWEESDTNTPPKEDKGAQVNFDDESDDLPF